MSKVQTHVNSEMAHVRGCKYLPSWKGKIRIGKSYSDYQYNKREYVEHFLQTRQSGAWLSTKESNDKATK